MFYNNKLKIFSLSAIMAVTVGSVACTKQKTTADANENNVLLGKVDGKEVSTSNLSDSQKNSLYKIQKQYYDATQNFLADYYVAQYMESYARKNNLANVDEAKKHYFEANAKVSKEEVDKFLKENAASPQLKQIPEDKRAEIVGNYLRQMAQSKATQALVQAAMSDGKIVAGMDKPVAPKLTFQTQGYSLAQNAQAPVTVVEFADYQCPYCVMAHTELQKTLEHYNKNNQTKVQFVYYDFPLSFHDQAVPASVAAYCASQQGQFWQMHDKIFSRQPRDAITAETFTAHAKDLKLDLVAFQKCQQDKNSVDAVNAHMAEGQRVGVQGTPAIFINGVRYEKQTNFEGLKAEIDALM